MNAHALAVAVSLAALLAASCSGSNEPAALDLLARAPDALVVQTGELGPDALAQHARDGWESAPQAGVLWSVGETASLFLDAADPLERTLALELSSPREDLTVSARLNGVELGSCPVTMAPSACELAAPAAAWRRGRNVLELEASRRHEHPSGAARGIGVASVRFGPSASATVAPGRVTLAAGAGALWHLEGPFARLALELEGGAADVVARRMDPLDGSAQEIAKRAVEPGGVAVVELPAVVGAVLQIELVAREPLAVVALEARLAGPVERPPIVFVSVDTFAARHASVHGYERETTPRLDRFASEGVTFAGARANAPFTLTSYLSQLTGLYPAAHSPTEGALEHLDPGRWTLAEALRAAGYTTGAFVDNPWLDRGFGFRQGFDVYDASAARINHNDPSGGSAHAIPLAQRWLATQLDVGRTPFLFLQVLDLHYPYLPVPPWDARFEADGLWDEGHELPVAQGEDPTFDTVPNLVARGIVKRGTVPERMRTAPIVAAYDQKIRELDERLAGFFDFLVERGLWDDAVVIVAADHGEAMLEHGYKFNHGLLYEEHLHVPLLVKLPGGRAAGTLVDASVQLVDLYPTVLELAGLDAERAYLHGRSLVSLLDGAREPARPVVAEGGVQRQRSIELDGWKLIESEPSTARWPLLLSQPALRPIWESEIEPALAAARETNPDAEPSELLAPILREKLAGVRRELYDLRADPLELNDVAAQHPERVAELAALLERERERAVAARVGAASVGPRAELDEEARAELRALGYAVGD